MRNLDHQDISEAQDTGGPAPGQPIPESTPGMPIVHLLRAVAVSLNVSGARFAEGNGLHPTDLRAIIGLLDAERAGIPATPGWLGENLRLNSASVTALVDRLERLGHVRRERDAADRRRVLLSVTPHAKELGWAFFGPLMTRMLEAMRGYRDDELALVQRFLGDMGAVVAAHGSAGRLPAPARGNRTA
jgi:DNA-binding MarR family transcriptional regulator